MTTLRHLLLQKGNSIWSIHPDASVFDAVKEMAEKNIGALVVIEDDQLIGLITERHYARNIVLKGRTSPKTRVRDIMQTNVICARPDYTVEQCMALMTSKLVRHLPIVDDGVLLGLVSIGDLVKSTISDQKFVIEQLEQYISGTR
ncbi:CBS domain-containing protein [Hyphomicrobium sp.]|uniref:CBS domain-containing protein n=1 Tax=Hyphomicrobium sp. TaxID=82 RepID=UPI002E333FA1|nr:CBS domain-containing protein [Hyphomicrobium sp.]HEX2842890.1 CBS domain-containing protein [Hyphomicrobium sp.]